MRSGVGRITACGQAADFAVSLHDHDVSHHRSGCCNFGFRRRSGQHVYPMMQWSVRWFVRFTRVTNLKHITQSAKDRRMSSESFSRTLAAFAVAVFALSPAFASTQSGYFTIEDSARACPVNLPYPPAALRNLVTGRSLVRISVANDGHVVNAYLLRPSGVMRFNGQLDDSAVQAARECRFPNSSDVRSEELRRGVVMYEWRIDGLNDPNPYSAGTLESLRDRANDGDADAAYWIYLRSGPLPNAPASTDALHWLSFAAEHGVQQAQKEIERLRAVGEDTSFGGNQAKPAAH